MKRLPCLICIVNAKFIVCLIFIFVNFFFFLFSFLFLFKQHDFYEYSRVWILCCYYKNSELGKTSSCKWLRQLKLISFQRTSSLKRVCGFQARIFITSFYCLVYYIVRISDQVCLGVYSQSNLLDRVFATALISTLSSR